MEMEEAITVASTPEATWRVLTDIDHCADVISGIKGIEILDRPESGLVGLKWRETRSMFGKDATETMWITDAEAPRFYQTRAESHGAVYISRFEIVPEGASVRLVFSFRAQPSTGVAKVLSALTGWMVKGSMKKMILQDLADIKAAVEQV